VVYYFVYNYINITVNSNLNRILVLCMVLSSDRLYITFISVRVLSGSEVRHWTLIRWFWAQSPVSCASGFCAKLCQG
jgi:hypothetical protein